MWTVSTFYHVVELDNYEDMQPLILDCCNTNEIKGTIIVSSEGINATVCALKKEQINNLIDFLVLDDRLKGIETKDTYSGFCPFERMKVLLRKEIVALGIDGINAKDAADYVDPQDWDKYISSDDIHLIDTRNFYETNLGSFKGAIVPNTQNFRDFFKWFAKWKDANNVSEDKKIAMFCTGGIRCEKSTALLKDMGFKNVVHLKGGIISYLMHKKLLGKNLEEMQWSGDCFVFDDRVALTYRLDPVQPMCSACSLPINPGALKNTTRGIVTCADCYDNVINTSVFEQSVLPQMYEE